MEDDATLHAYRNLQVSKQSIRTNTIISIVVDT